MSTVRKELHSLICVCVFTVFVSTQHLEPNVQILPLNPVRNLFCENNDDCTACKNPFVWRPSTDTCVLPKAECSTVYETGASSKYREKPVFRSLSSNEPGTATAFCSPKTRECNASVVVEGFCDPNSHYTILQNLIINTTTAKSLRLFLNGRQYIVKATPENLANARFSEMLAEGETIKVSYESMSEKNLELKLSMETCCRPHNPVIACGEHCRSCTLSGQDLCDENGCKEGYVLDGQTKTCRTMFNCSEHCTSCTQSGSNLCDENSCEDGFMFDSQTNTCEPICSTNDVTNCADHCWSCASSGKNKCDEKACKDGYTLDSQTKTCTPVIKCGDHCWSCESSGEGKCDKNACKYGYTLDSETETCKRETFPEWCGKNGYTYFSTTESCFKVFLSEGEVTYERANELCQSPSIVGRLAFLHTEERYKAVESFIRPLIEPSSKHVWIGLSRKIRGDCASDFVWTSRSGTIPMTFSAWIITEPSCSLFEGNSEKESVGEAYFINGQLLFNDLEYTWTAYALCEATTLIN